MQPLQLLTAQRFDLPAKTLYLRYRNKNVNTDFGLRVYEHHLKVWNNLHELNPPKRGLQQYLDSLHNVYRAIRDGSFDWKRSPIPIENGHAVNGGHRLASAIVAHKTIEVDTSKKQKGQLCPYSYLANRTTNIPGGLRRDYADAMALEFCRLSKPKQDVYIATVFPSANGQDDKVRKILQAHGSIIYHKPVRLTKNGGKNLIRQVYLGEKWIGNYSNKFKGALGKSNPCYERDGVTQVFLIQTSKPQGLTVAKEQIRKLFNKGKHTVHINDTWEETDRLAKLFFNDNSIDHLNRAQETYCEYQEFHQLFDRFIEWLKKEGINSEDVCIDASATMAMYGIRKCRDLDFLHHGKIKGPTFHRDISSHNDWAHHYKHTISEIVYDPAYHFYYRGIKFASLDVVKQMKLKRNEDKDKRDVALIESFIK